ncbi:hypothetical protein ONZ43_g1268 [Nemania bipapillata]|uniref:Uncharacterized protein n=1 Tax=Nemania bipapillata TaxID=110536 RepID=A0ACC2J550_9PEZI|nr:hypothetical protein ONZ43_g1268 [Nemania bipapillata]
MTVRATGKNSGSVTLDNKTTGKSVSHTFTNQIGNLCQTNAEWIVEDFSQGNSLVPFANFGTVVFTGASVNGATGLDKAIIYDIKQGNKVYTSCSASSPSSTYFEKPQMKSSKALLFFDDKKREIYYPTPKIGLTNK